MASSALQEAANALVDRHEPLRTSFVLDEEGVFRQQVRAAGTLPVVPVDLSACADPEATALALIREIATRPVDLALDPLASVTVLLLGEQEHLLVFTLHLLIADAASLGVFFRELALLYDAEIDARSVELPELDVQHADWIVWRRERLTADRELEMLSWWEAAVRGACWGLPRPNRPRRSGSGRQVRGAPLPREVVDAVGGLAIRARTTPFAVLAAACGVLLGHHAAHDRVMLSIPIADRDDSRIDNALGFFVDLVPLCVDLSGEPTPAELASRVGRSVFEAYEHRALTADLIPGATASSDDLVPVNFAHRLIDRLGVLDLSGCTVIDVPQAIEHVKVDLTIAVDETNDGLVVVIEFDDGLFDVVEVEGIVAGYEATLRELVINGAAN